MYVAYKEQFLQVASSAEFTDEVGMLIILVDCQKLDDIAALLQLCQQVNLPSNLAQNLASCLRPPPLSQHLDCHLQRSEGVLP